jgi:type IV pilus assembly protein PilN
MATINLLPWREEHRQLKKREFLNIVLMVLVFAAVVSFAWDRVVNAQIDNQTSRNQLLTDRIAELEKQVKEIEELKERKRQMLDRMAVIQSLQSNRPDIVKVFDELVRAMPQGVYLGEFTRKGLDASIVGFAESNNRVSSLMRNLDASYKFTDPNLTKVEADDNLGEQGNRFEMRVKLTEPVINDSDKQEQEG